MNFKTRKNVNSSKVFRKEKRKPAKKVFSFLVDVDQYKNTATSYTYIYYSHSNPYLLLDKQHITGYLYSKMLVFYGVCIAAYSYISIKKYEVIII